MIWQRNCFTRVLSYCIWIIATLCTCVLQSVIFTWLIFFTLLGWYLHKLQQIQNSAFRIILGTDIDTSVREMHKSLNLLTLSQRRTIHLAMEYFNCINNKESGLHKLFTLLSEIKIRTTRQTEAKLMSVPDIHTNTGHKAFSYRGPNSWNRIETSIRLIENKNNFKKEITKTTCLDINHLG